MEPGEKLERTLAGGRGSPMVRDFGLRLRPDLCRSYPVATSRRDANRQKAKLVAKLLRRGFAVNGDRRVWRVYVVELGDGVGPRLNPELPWVYVGETSKAPEERFQEHLSGARNRRGRLYSTVVRDHGRRLRPDLYESEPLLYTQADAKFAETALFNKLVAAGYSARGGH